jgi:protein PsiE
MQSKEMDGMMVMWESVAILILAGAAYLMSMKDKMSLEKLKENSDKD